MSIDKNEDLLTINEDGFGQKNTEVPEQDINPSEQIPTDTNSDVEGNKQVNDTSLPSAEEETNQPDMYRKLPSDDSNIGDNPIFPSREDLVPQNEFDSPDNYSNQ